MRHDLAVYPGSFDPFTLGHFNIVGRAAQIFDRVIVSVAEDSDKNAMFSPEERFEMISKIFHGSKSIEVDRFQGLLVHYLREKNCRVLLRGIRTVSDFEFEYQMALANKTLNDEVETFFMMTEGRYSYLSSTVIKEIARLGGDIGTMVPQEVVQYVRSKYQV